jgi:transketolase
MAWASPSRASTLKTFLSGSGSHAGIASSPKVRSGKLSTRRLITSSNLVVADINRLRQRGPTDLGWDVEVHKQRCEAFGARSLVVDGHNPSAIDGAFAEVEEIGGDRPTVIVAKTIKGRGFSEAENKGGWRGKPFPADMARPPSGSWVATADWASVVGYWRRPRARARPQPLSPTSRTMTSVTR